MEQHALALNFWNTNMKYQYEMHMTAYAFKSEHKDTNYSCATLVI